MAQANKPRLISVAVTLSSGTEPSEEGCAAMSSEQLRDMQLVRSHCQRGALARLAPCLSFPEPVLSGWTLLQYRASAMTL